jgi:hypothetical protein
MTIGQFFLFILGILLFFKFIQFLLACQEAKNKRKEEARKIPRVPAGWRDRVSNNN